MCVNPEVERPDPFTFSLAEREELMDSWYTYMSLGHEDDRLNLLLDRVERLIRKRKYT